MTQFRCGAEYRRALCDGRRIWVAGEGLIEDVTVHSTTRRVVDEYVTWFDRHSDPAWQEIVLTPPNTDGLRLPWGYVLPKTADDLSGMGRCFSKTAFPNAGSITHTPAYGHLVALGILIEVHKHSNSTQQTENITAYYQDLVRTGRFLTFAAGQAPIGYRLRAISTDRVALRIIRETDEGLVISGKIGMHTSAIFADDVYVGAHCGIEYLGERATFIVSVNAPGVTVVSRKPLTSDPNPFVAPLSSRYDELDGQLWLNNVVIRWDRVFLVDPSLELIVRWLFWHQLHCWLARADFTLGLALACTHAMGLIRDNSTVDYLVDLIIDVQTVRSCLTAAERDPQFMDTGYCYPNRCHLAAGSIAMLKARPRMNEILRILPGSSAIIVPSDRDLTEQEMAADMEEAFGGGGYTALQRSALLQMVRDLVSSPLEAREAAFELHGSGGMPAWRGRLRRGFERYNELANGVIRELGIPMPEIDVSSIGASPFATRLWTAGGQLSH